MLKNAPILAIRGVDTAEIWPSGRLSILPQYLVYPVPASCAASRPQFPPCDHPCCTVLQIFVCIIIIIIIIVVLIFTIITIIIFTLIKVNIIMSTIIACYHPCCTVLQIFVCIISILIMIIVIIIIIMKLNEIIDAAPTCGSLSS